VTAGAARQNDGTSRGAAEAPRLVGLSTAPLLVAPLRIGLALLGCAGALARGLSLGVTAVAFALGAGGFAVAALADPRRQFFRIREETAAVPDGAVFVPRGRVALAALYPSSIGLAVLTAVALTFNPALAAVMAGGLAGLGVAGAVTGAGIALQERADGIRLYVERGTRRIFSHPFP
jgi:hypothetical protein